SVFSVSPATPMRHHSAPSPASSSMHSPIDTMRNPIPAPRLRCVRLFRSATHDHACLVTTLGLSVLHRLHGHEGGSLRDMRQGGYAFAQHTAVGCDIARAHLEQVVEA